TFHRAFDMARDPKVALEDLISLGVDRLLTSGQERSALEGLSLLKDLILQARGRIVVVPAAGIMEGNIRRIVDETGAREVHVSARREVKSPMQHRNPRPFLGREPGPPEFTRWVTDSRRVREIIRKALHG